MSVELKEPAQWCNYRHHNSPFHPESKHKKAAGKCLASNHNPSLAYRELSSRKKVESCVQARDFVSLLRSCSKNGDLDAGTLAHECIVGKNLLAQCSDALVTMYAKYGALVKAQELLDNISSANAYTWTALINAYARHHQGLNAFKCFEQMKHAGLSPDAVTFSCILKACSDMRAIDKGRQIHDEIMLQGLLESDIILGNALIDMYAKCGALDKARHVLWSLPAQDAVSWNTLISGYIEQGQHKQALDTFEQMRKEGVHPTVVTFICVLKACGCIKAIDKGEKIHEEIARLGLLEHNLMLGTALLDMYANCGVLSKAQQVLESLTYRDVASWNALIAGYAQQGQGKRALECFANMQAEQVAPSAMTFCSVLDACGHTRAIDKGEEIYREIARQGYLQSNVPLGTAVVDMFMNCGAFMKAERALRELPFESVAPWNALITGYAKQGQSGQALERFDQMICEGICPDAATFSGVLNACNNLGLVDDGYMHFFNMRKTYGVKPDLRHYTCMVDLFGRAGHLDKATELIKEMPSTDDYVVWSALLGACQKWGDADVARKAFENVGQLDKKSSAAYALMANIYAAVGLENDARKY